MSLVISSILVSMLQIGKSWYSWWDACSGAIRVDGLNIRLEANFTNSNLFLNSLIINLVSLNCNTLPEISYINPRNRRKTNKKYFKIEW